MQELPEYPEIEDGTPDVSVSVQPAAYAMAAFRIEKKIDWCVKAINVLHRNILDLERTQGRGYTREAFSLDK